MNNSENNEPKMNLSLSDIVYLGFREFNEMYKQKLEEDKRHHLALEEIMATMNASKRQKMEFEENYSE